MLVDLLVDWKQQRVDETDNNDGKHFGIYTFDVPEEEIDTDDMFNNDLVGVQWFETRKEQELNYREEPYTKE
jgi:hypothetical protein